MTPPSSESAALEIGLTINDPRWESLPFALEDALRRAVLAVHHEVVPWVTAEVSVVLTDDGEIQTLNRTYRQKDRPTNVLSFGSLEAPLEPGMTPPMPGPFLLGDLVLAFETITREAENQGKSLGDHLMHLVVHGMLHLLGYDHGTDEDAERMESLEIKILSPLGIKNPYTVMEG